MKRRKTSRKSRSRGFDIQSSIFVVLLSVIVLERLLTLFASTTGFTCLDQRTLMIGATQDSAGFYDWIIAISLLALAATVAGVTSDLILSEIRRLRSVVFAVTNILISVALIFLCAIPWAYYHVEHPLSKAVYAAQKVVPFEMYVVLPPPSQVYYLDPDTWECTTEDCRIDLDDVESTYRHRELNITIRRMVTAECMSSEFNRATMRASGQSIDGYSGEKTSKSFIYFDSNNRLIGPRDRVTLTDHLRQQLNPSQLEPSDWDFRDLLSEISARSSQEPLSNSNMMPRWISWEEAISIIDAGRVETVYQSGSMLFGLELTDGSNYIGSIPHSQSLRQAIVDCERDCEHTILVEE